MDKNTLKQYKALKKEIQLLERKIEKLRDRALDIPTVFGKVTASSKDFPYIPERITVQMDAPKESDAVHRLIQIKKVRLEQAQRMVIEIELFIATIPDSDTRQIFESVYIDGKPMSKVPGFTKSGVSKKIDRYLKCQPIQRNSML